MVNRCQTSVTTFAVCCSGIYQAARIAPAASLNRSMVWDTLMGYDESEQDSNLEVEIGSLRAPASSATLADAQAGRASFVARRTRREHLRRGIAVTAGLVVVLAALVLSIAPTREALRGVVIGPTPTATARVPAGEDSLYIALNPNWGAVSLDDHTLARLPIEGIDQPLRLSRGPHTIRWRFAPILEYTCRLTVPSAPGDTCPTRTGIQPGKKGIASVVTLQLALPMLAPAYRHALVVAMQSALDAERSSEIVRPGEVYRSDDAALGFPVMVAHQPLRATLRFVLDAENHNVVCPAIDSGPGVHCMMNGDCRELCTAPWQSPPGAPGGAYQAYIVAHPTWRYTALDGHVVAENAPDIAVQPDGPWYDVFDERPIPITITWDGAQWRASVVISGNTAPGELPNPVCGTAEDEIPYSLSPPTPAGWQAVAATYVPGAPPATGRLLLMTVPGERPILLLHRFGVMLAANDAARRSLGVYLPVVDAYERTIAQELARQNHLIVTTP